MTPGTGQRPDQARVATLKQGSVYVRVNGDKRRLA